MKKIKAFVEIGKDGTYGVYVDLKDNTLNYGVIGDGKTAKEAIEDFKICYEEMKNLYEEEGKKFVEADFEFHYDVASFLSYYNQFLSLVGLSKLTGINKAQLSHYIQGFRNPSVQTAKKIQLALNNFADELKSIQFT
ncbi:type II toxin-antitoxin system HicB family antitoxin [Ornithobacterium rhinotracheale]|uniref:type II toxin-antitoxin system HicB family antitoxin n=1 Tax=Ornithobacterium rhinotracheale TaxID=28251 RepID=UPI00129C8476|nr:helix-turn-helix transcriptional regulator [Ornithobacterium rhinotracheale]MRI64185.1 XRE family transcriptional regulator [Ornithobacterium rhinotracheale]MRJ09080.1 XRE family transcriptional regulator [Ornithobacterium rhinotracheale]MRJ09761.1 XRE family transcriptional regulator [Ornithobacterium rhinotracheale]UOH77851.1 helix-turn-helix transcriptional regulator [Ornithobacterium rhinotracheale]